MTHDVFNVEISCPIKKTDLHVGRLKFSVKLIVAFVLYYYLKKGVH